MIKFKDLELGKYFRYQNKEFRKCNPIDLGSILYNSITDWVGEIPYDCQYIQWVQDDKMVRPIEDKEHPYAFARKEYKP